MKLRNYASKQSEAIQESHCELALADFAKFMGNKVDLVNDQLFSCNTSNRISGQVKAKPEIKWN